MQKIIAFIVLLALFCAVMSPCAFAVENYSPAKVSMPPVSAASAVLIDAESANILSEKNAHTRMAPASTTKIMTALVAVENSSLEKIVSVSPLAVGVEGSSVYLFAGEQITMLDLIYAMLLESANDAAAAIAIEVGGSIEGFCEMMNEKAKELGLRDTNFKNPHGLYDEEHYTTAYELAKISSAALKNDVIRRIVRTKKHTLVAHKGNDRMLYNHNKMLSLYEGAVGVKTGFTKKSGRTLVSAAERDGLLLIAVTLGAPDDWNDHKKMLDCGFENFSRVDLAVEPYQLPVVGGRSSLVTLMQSGKTSLTLSKDDAQRLQTKIEPYWRFAFAPAKTGDVAGHVSYYLDGKQIARDELIFATDCSSLEEPKGLWAFIKKIFYS